MLGSAESEKIRLISREIIFQEFEPITTTPQRHRRTDGQLASAVYRTTRSFAR